MFSAFPRPNARRHYGLFAVLAVGSLSTLLFCAAPASAQLINGSFENGTFSGSNPQSAADSTQLLAGSTAVTGWTSVNETAWLQTGNPYGAFPSDGNRLIDLTGYHDSQPEGGMQQVLTLVPGTTYKLGFDLGYDSNLPASPDGVTATIAEAGVNQTFFNPGSGIGLTVGTTFWQTFTLNFTPTVATNTLLLQGSSTSSGPFIGLDNVTLVSVGPAGTPEPGNMALLLGIGLSGASVFARRRRKPAK